MKHAANGFCFALHGTAPWTSPSRPDLWWPFEEWVVLGVPLVLTLRSGSAPFLFWTALVWHRTGFDSRNAVFVCVFFPVADSAKAMASINRSTLLTCENAQRLCRVNPFTTGNPFLGTKLLGFSIGRGSGALKELRNYRVLIHLTTGKRLTNFLPKLGLVQHSSPLKRRDRRSAGYTGGRVNILAVPLAGETGKTIFQVRHGASHNFFNCWWMVGFEPTAQKPMVCRRRHLSKNYRVLSIVHLTTGKRITNFLPKIGLV